MDVRGFDEAGVWARARDGDPTAFQRLFDAHRDRVFGQALRQLRSAHDAEDATALVFFEAWRRRAEVRVVDGSIVAWLLVATNYVCLNLVRSMRRHRAAMERVAALEGSGMGRGSTADDEGGIAAVEERIDRAPRDRRLRSAFARLSQADQDVITLCVLEELSTAQAAEALGVPAGTVKSRLSRAKRRLAHLTDADAGAHSVADADAAADAGIPTGTDASDPTASEPAADTRGGAR